MSRHRNVRSMNYQDEYDGYDDVYGHSLEDSYCVSPATAAQFLYYRDQEQNLAAFITEPDIPEEEIGSDLETHEPQKEAYHRPALSDLDEARLESCLEQVKNVVGESITEQVLVKAVLKFNFDSDHALDYILCQQDQPKPQRQPRIRTKKTDNDDSEAKHSHSQSDPSSETSLITVYTDAGKNKTAASSSSVDDLTKNTSQITFTSSKPARTGFFIGETTEKIIDIDVSPETPNRMFVSDSDINNSLGTPKKTSPSSGSPLELSPSASPAISRVMSRSKLEKIDARKEYESRKAASGGKDLINLVVVGHVDAGKSTLMGHILYQLGFVNRRTMHKYEQESKKLGKASFAFAWVLDETEEERSRGVTMDIAQTKFETETKSLTLLDAPGHKDFIPNMITGAAQADVAILAVNATRGEFETGFEAGGQTREHAMLIRSLGVSQLLVAVNKMDTVGWDKERYTEITKKLSVFLKQAGFKESDLAFVPCSGLSGENLVKKASDPLLTAWYNGPTIVERIDKFQPPERPLDKPVRMCVTDVFKGMGGGFNVAGTIQAGSLQQGDKLLVMPLGDLTTIKSITIDETIVPFAFAGDTVTLTLTGMEMASINVGCILCDVMKPIQAATRIVARVVLFNIDLPITKGFPVLFHYQSLNEQAVIKKLICQLHKSTGEVVRNKPRCLTKNSNAVIELEISRPVCLELYKDYKDLGRFMLRHCGTTIAAGLITEILTSKAV